jgi:hypothetical protein
MKLSAQDTALLDILKLVRERPAIILQGVSFERLHGFINGVLLGLFWPRLAESPLIDLFQDWLRAQTGLDTWAGWDGIIRLLSSDDRHAFDTFYKQLDAFLKDSPPS